MIYPTQTYTPSSPLKLSPPVLVSPSPIQAIPAQQGQAGQADTVSSSHQSFSIAAQLAKKNVANGLPESVKVQQAEQMVLALLQKFANNRSGLLNYLQTQLGVEVIDSIKTPWANQLLRNRAANAYTMMNDGQDAGSKQDLKQTGVLSENEIKDLMRAGRTFLIINQDKVSNDTLYHEVFHLCQFMNGIQAGNIQPKAAALRDNFMTELMNGNTAKVLWNNVKGAFLFDFKIIGLIKEVPNGSGAHLRQNIRMESQAYDFLIKNQAVLGLSQLETKLNKIQRNLYKILSNLSWKLDWEERKQR